MKLTLFCLPFAVAIAFAGSTSNRTDLEKLLADLQAQEAQLQKREDILAQSISMYFNKDPLKPSDTSELDAQLSLAQNLKDAIETLQKQEQVIQQQLDALPKQPTPACPAPPEDPNASNQVQGADNGQTVGKVCKPGFGVPEKYGIYTCNNGVLTPKVTNCQPGCTQTFLGKKSGSLAAAVQGTVVHLKCPPGKCYSKPKVTSKTYSCTGASGMWMPDPSADSCSEENC